MTQTVDKEKTPGRVAASLPRIIPGNAQHIGARGEQQDSFGFSDFENEGFMKHAGILVIVADGMGGMALGKESSATAVQTFLNVYAEKEADESIAQVLDRCLHRANRAVNRKAAEAGVEGEAGTTLVAAVIYDKHLYRLSAGDSRIYLFRDDALKQLTQDYNYGRVLDQMVEKGEISRAEAASHPSRAALTSYLGKAELDEYDSPTDEPIELKPGDKVLLASDGLFGFLPEKEIEALMRQYPQQAAEALVQATIGRNQPYQDNVTVAILGYELPIPVPLADTQVRKPTKTEVVGNKTTVQKKMGKWTKIALVLIFLAVASFLGGKVLFENNFVESKPAIKSQQGEPTPKKEPEAKQDAKIDAKPDIKPPAK